MISRDKMRPRVLGGLGIVLLTWALWKSTATRTAALATGVFVGSPALAAADEVRTFAVSVDGRPSGTYTVSTAAADGTESVTVAADVKVKTTFLTYTYELRSVETWRAGRLVSVEAKSNDNGKVRTVSATARDGKLAVTVNKATHTVAAEVVTSTGVRPPGGDKPAQAIYFDVEDGAGTPVRVEPVGPRRVALDGRPIDGQGYKLSGKDVACEWWYDAGGGAIRQEMTWDGRKVVFELTAVRK